MHTRNVGTLDCQLVAWLAGVAVSHPRRARLGRPRSRRHEPQVPRRSAAPSIPSRTRFVTVSEDLKTVADRARRHPGAQRSCSICNGVDTQRFLPRDVRRDRRAAAGERFTPGSIVIGSVTRFSEIKDPLNLVRAFLGAARAHAGEHGTTFASLARRRAAARRRPKRLLRRVGGTRCSLARRAAATTWRRCCARWTSSCWVRCAKAFRIPCSRRWRAACRSSRRPTGGNLELIERGMTGELVPPGDSPQPGAGAAPRLRVEPQRGGWRTARPRAGARGARLFAARMMNRYAELYQHALQAFRLETA